MGGGGGTTTTPDLIDSNRVDDLRIVSTVWILRANKNIGK